MLPKDFELLPIILSGRAKIKDNYRFQLLIRGPSAYPMSHALAALMEQQSKAKAVKVLIDINPSSTFF